jgi:membrane protein required for colicin V production
MNWLDILILILTGVGLIKGLIDGIIKQVVSLLALVAGIYLCAGAGDLLIGYLSQFHWFPQKYARIISYFLGFVLISSMVLLAGYIVNKIVSATPLSVINHLIGGIVGLMIMIVIISLIFNVLEIFDKNSAILPHEIKVESRFYMYVKNIIPSFFPGNLFGLKV